MTDLLTDDEVVAIATRTRPWPFLLPTVDVTSRESLAAAALRGMRSLGVRGLVERGPDGEPALVGPSPDLLRRLCEATEFAVAYVAAADSTSLAGTITVVADDGAVAVLDLVSDGGVHELAEIPRDRADSVIRAYLKNGFDHGVSGEGAVFFFESGRGNAEVLRVTRGLLAWGAFAGQDFEAARTSSEWTDDFGV